MFALPWYLTWFGHSLNQYHDVVRLYDYFLAHPPLMPIYVATSLVIYRRQDVFDAGCDMASIHCLLSQIPDRIDFEEVLRCSTKLYKKIPPTKVERDVRDRIQKEYVYRLWCALLGKLQDVFRVLGSFVNVQLYLVTFVYGLWRGRKHRTA